MLMDTNKTTPLQYHSDCFKPIDVPKSNDWLASQKEPSQSYLDYKESEYNKVTPERR
jgi:hypothetical protein